MHDGIPQSQVATLTPVEGLDPAASRLEEVLTKRELKNRLKWKVRAKVWAVPLMAVLGGGTWAGIELNPFGNGTALQEVKEQADENAKQNRALGKFMIEGLDYLGNKIDAAHPEVIPEEKPESLKQAEEVLEEQKQETRLNKVLETGGFQQEG